MARPLRRVLISLSIRLNQPLCELEQLDMPTIREYLAVLTDMNKPNPPPGAPVMPRKQTPAQIEAALLAAFGKPKVKD